MTTVFKIFGSSGDTDTFFSQHVANRIVESSPGVTLVTEIFLELDYIKKLNELKPVYGNKMYGHKSTHLIIRDDTFIGSLMDLIKIAVDEYGIEDAEIANVLFFEKKCKEETTKLLQKSGNQAVFLEFSRAEKLVNEDEPYLYGKVIIEMFNDKCPLACENFSKLCSGSAGQFNIDNNSTGKFHYLDTPIHRIVPNGWIQCGDIVDGSGSNSISAIDPSGKFRDESFEVDFGAEYGGIVGYSSPEPHSNGSQFFITLGPCEWMNNKAVGFGRVVQGYPVLKALSVAEAKNQRHDPKIIISNCGIYYLK